MEEEVPIQWNEAEIILIFKKRNKNEIKNYRPISLTSNLGKTFMKILKDRLDPQLDSQQPREQAGFRKNYWTIDQIFIIKPIIEKANEYNLKASFFIYRLRKSIPYSRS